MWPSLCAVLRRGCHASSGHGRQESAARGTLGVSPRLLGVSRVVLAVGRPGSVAGAPPCTHPATVWPG
eukprot:COSAG01_NODE_8483_length_2770_cov_2.789966_2_plen_68_part_00